MKKNKLHYLIIACLLLVAICFYLGISSSKFAQEFIGSWLGGLDPQRLEHLKERLNDKPSQHLIALLEHGDFNKAAAAESILADREPKDYFYSIAGKLNSDSKRVRKSAMRILPRIDQNKASRILVDFLNNTPSDSDDYSLALSVLAHHKCSEVYPFLIEYANRPNAWHTAVADYLAEYGDPASLPLLQDLYKTIPQNNGVSESIARRRIQKAIAELEAISKL